MYEEGKTGGVCVLVWMGEERRGERRREEERGGERRREEEREMEMEDEQR